MMKNNASFMHQVKKLKRVFKWGRALVFPPEKYNFEANKMSEIQVS
jgi:hypothetical protein